MTPGLTSGSPLATGPTLHRWRCSEKEEAPAHCGKCRPGLHGLAARSMNADLTSGGSSSLAGALTSLRSRCSERRSLGHLGAPPIGRGFRERGMDQGTHPTAIIPL